MGRIGGKSEMNTERKHFCRYFLFDAMTFYNFPSLHIIIIKSFFQFNNIHSDLH